MLPSTIQYVILHEYEYVKSAIVSVPLSSKHEKSKEQGKALKICSIPHHPQRDSTGS